MLSAVDAIEGWELRPLGEPIGAALIGPDLSRPLADREFAALHAALVENPVLVIRGQALEPGDCKRLGRCFGRLWFWRQRVESVNRLGSSSAL